MELNLQLGRIQDNGELNDIKGDRQNRDEILNSEKNYLLEKEARNQFRKWDNVKYTAESVTKKMIPKNSYTIRGSRNPERNEWHKQNR